MINKQILGAFGLTAETHQISALGAGLINLTWKVTGQHNTYVLQRINKNIFKNPADIDFNLSAIQSFLQRTAPGYLFAGPIPAINGEGLVIDNGECYRLTPFVKNSHTINFITHAQQAYQAAKQFGRFSKLLHGFDVNRLKYTLPHFHNLNLRTDQYRQAVKHASNDRLKLAADAIHDIAKYTAIADSYAQIVNDKVIPLRVTHHDTKINNVLFDKHDNGLCVIDLDTVMPGYYLSDVGDMMRTYLAEASEEEQDTCKIIIRAAVFNNIYQGYMEEMGSVLDRKEKELFFYSGKYMIYMQALRFLTDFLNDDTYYHTSYPGQNLARAQNQLVLLKQYCAFKDVFNTLLNDKFNQPDQAETV